MMSLGIMQGDESNDLLAMPQILTGLSSYFYKWIRGVIVARDVISLGMLQAENVSKPEIERILKFPRSRMHLVGW